MTVAQKWSGEKRLGGLRRFAIAISLLNLIGHTLLGFEQSWAQPLVALLTAYATELLIETVNAFAQERRPRYSQSFPAFVDFLLSAHISGLAVSMLLYANERLAVIAFAAAVAIASKALIRVPIGKGPRHFLNPSNFGVTLTLLLFPWVGIAQPYQFTENLAGAGDWILPGVIVVSGTFLNARFTGRLPLIGAWLGAFAMQAFVRSIWFAFPVQAALMPMTGATFILYTFYMITDPATTPSSLSGQLTFGSAVALTYGVLMAMHVVFGLFFALSVVTAARGLAILAQSWTGSLAGPRAAATVPAMASRPTP
jgi:Na+-translocating ferredoxin:NAD+ oxidoreductase RnfD subunit